MTAGACALAEHVERLPLTLKLGATVAKRQGRPFLLERVQHEGGTIQTLRRWPEESRQDSLRRSLDLSYKMMEDRARGLFVNLGGLETRKSFALSDIETSSMGVAGETWEPEDALLQL